MFYSFEKNSYHTENLLFVAKALGKNHLSYIHSDGVEIVATDGHRCHIYTPPADECPLPKGFYKIIKRTKTKIDILLEQNADLIFPDYKRIVPNLDGVIPFKYRSTIYNAFAQVTRALGEGALNYNYFADTIGADLDCEFKTNGQNVGVLFKWAYKTAVIMPIIEPEE